MKGFVQIRTQKFFMQFSLIVVFSGKFCNFLQQMLDDMECLSEVVIKEKPWMNQMNMDLETFSMIFYATFI